MVPRRRAGLAWVALAPGALALALILLFVLQNSASARVHFLAWSGRIGLGVALVFAALLGGLVVFGLGSVRIVQLRRLTRRRSAEQKR